MKKKINCLLFGNYWNFISVFCFIIWINGILIPYFQICLELSNFQATLVAFASCIAYFFMAILAAGVLGFTGYKKGMEVGMFIMALGTVIFIPAAYSRTYAVFITGLFITGTGLALLQTAAANLYIAILGPIGNTITDALSAGFYSFITINNAFVDSNTFINPGRASDYPGAARYTDAFWDVYTVDHQSGVFVKSKQGSTVSGFTISNNITVDNLNPDVVKFVANAQAATGNSKCLIKGNIVSR